jgi:phosphohistidine phosphatase
MNLILWRHAEAEDAPVGGDDLARSLTPRGEREAARVGAWLDRALPEGARVLCSPARRCEQTALALGRKFKLMPELAPDSGVEALLKAARWPDARQPVLIVGHQPTLGQTVALLRGMAEGTCAVRKGGVWWLRARERHAQLQAVVVTVQSPDLLAL